MSSFRDLVLFLAIVTTSQLVRSDPCPAPSPCYCSGTSIYCSDKHMTSVPPLISTDNTTYYLYLDSNPNLVITDDSFVNISLEYLNLNYDTNITISYNAFKTQRNTLKEVSISNVNLLKIPNAIEDLPALQKLHLGSNNALHWDAVLMEKLGITLTMIDISDNGFTSWPTWLTHMSNLNELNVRGNPFGVIPHNAFDSFKTRLSNLDITNTGISEMPTALQNLHMLAQLQIGGSSLNDSSFYETWLPSHTSSRVTLTISNTRITKVPAGLRWHRSIKSLYILGSMIKHVKEESMPTHLELFHLTNSLLTRIHGGICSSTLTNLLLDGNKIESIEKHDLHDCLHLTYFSADYNNIDYISPTAFYRLKSLSTLYLQGNKLKRIPVSIKYLHALSSLYLNSNPLECTCQDDWFPQWLQNNTSVSYIGGHCTYLNIDLKDFHPHCSGSIIG